MSTPKMGVGVEVEVGVEVGVVPVDALPPQFESEEAD